MTVIRGAWFHRERGEIALSPYEHVSQLKLFILWPINTHLGNETIGSHKYVNTCNIHQRNSTYKISLLSCVFSGGYLGFWSCPIHSIMYNSVSQNLSYRHEHSHCFDITVITCTS